MIQDILAERNKTHGSFLDNSRISQSIKIIIDSCERASSFSYIQAEALDMIAHKIGRICSGDPNHEDHWRDIAGYATLIADNLNHNELPTIKSR